MAKERVNITMDKEIKNYITEEAEVLGLSVSEILTIFIEKYKATQEKNRTETKEIKEMMNKVDKLRKIKLEGLENFME